MSDDEASIANLPDVYTSNEKLLQGYAAQKKPLTGLLQCKEAAAVEVPIPADGTLGIVTVEKPLSRGTVHINAKDPAGPPDILFNAFVEPIDRVILGIGVRYLRKVMARPELESLSIVETSPGASATSDDELLSAFMASGTVSPTFAHPSCTCPTMPEEKGGCVSDTLLVYDTKHLSIIDASIFPLIPSQHLQSTAYMVGEKAADLIKQRAGLRIVI